MFYFVLSRIRNSLELIFENRSEIFENLYPALPDAKLKNS